MPGPAPLYHVANVTLCSHGGKLTSAVTPTGVTVTALPIRA